MFWCILPDDVANVDVRRRAVLRLVATCDLRRRELKIGAPFSSADAAPLAYAAPGPVGPTLVDMVFSATREDG